jgi:protein JSN1
VGNAQPASGLAMNPALRQVLDASGSPGRARSGSLTLPSPGLSNAFGQPIFASSGYGRQVAPGSRPPMMEGMSRGYSNDSIENEAMSNGVLDYLGLAESPSPSYAPVPATLSELKAQAQQQIQNSRSRASTVSSPYRQTRATLSTSLLSDALVGDDGHEYGAYNGPAPGAYPALSQTPPNAFKKATHLMPSSRPRATSVGTLLDSPSARNKASSAYTSAHEVDAVAQKMSQQLHLSAGPGQYPGQQQQQLLPGTLQRPPLDQHRSDTNVSAAYLQQQGHALHARTGSLSTANTPRAHTPDTGAIATALVTQGPPQLPPLATSSAQVPTRSLWLGNLDAAVTTQELMRVFHVYGAIESLRLLPDKECGFVNFVEKADAIRAMDDVRHRLGGRISTLGEGKPVRVGYGKVDSVPLGPGSVTSPTEPGPGGITNEVQAAPTRALWIGSIPANTTPAKLLSVNGGS